MKGTVYSGSCHHGRVSHMRFFRSVVAALLASRINGKASSVSRVCADTCWPAIKASTKLTIANANVSAMIHQSAFVPLQLLLWFGAWPFCLDVGVMLP